MVYSRRYLVFLWMFKHLNFRRAKIRVAMGEVREMERKVTKEKKRKNMNVLCLHEWENARKNPRDQMLLINYLVVGLDTVDSLSVL